MNKGPRLVVLGAILGSLIVSSLTYFVSAGASFPTSQPQKPVQSQEPNSSPTQPVNQNTAASAVPVSVADTSTDISAEPVITGSLSPTQTEATTTTVALTPTSTATATAQSTPTKAASAKPKKQKPKCQISGSYPQSILQWCNLITQYSAKYSLDPNLIAAVMLQESGGNADAYSSSGAVGLMQVMPNDGLAASFSCPSGPCFANRPSSQELFDPEFNISYGVRMIASLLDKYGNIQDALKAYGPGGGGYYYVNKVMAIYNNYK